MKNLSILLLLCFLSSISAKAQKKCIPVPDEVGKAIAAAFLNKEDIRKLPVFPGKAQMDLIDQSDEEPVAMTVSSGKAAPEPLPLIREWERLMYQAKQKNILPSNTVYENSYFLIREVDDNGKKYQKYELYMALKQKTGIIAIKTGLRWHQDRWVLTNVSDIIYQYRNRRKNEITFVRPDGEFAFPKKMPAIAYTAAVKTELWTKGGTCVTDPETFMKDFLKELATRKNAKDLKALLSFEDFKKYYKPELLRLLLKTSKQQGLFAEDKKEILTMQNELSNQPEKFYKEHFSNDLQRLSDYLSTINFSAKSLLKIESKIQNFENEVMGNGKIIAEIDAEVSSKNGKEGIRVKAYWLDGRWQLVYVPSGTYGIEEAQ